MRTIYSFLGQYKITRLNTVAGNSKHTRDGNPCDSLSRFTSSREAVLPLRESPAKQRREPSLTPPFFTPSNFFNPYFEDAQGATEGNDAWMLE